MASVSYVGGSCDSVIGGLDDTKGYTTSVHSLAKQQLIRQIAAEFASKMKLKFDASKQDLDEIIHELEKHVPNPKKNKKTYSSDAQKQRDACIILGNILNAHLGRQVVDTKGKAEIVCAQVFECLYSIFHSITGELHSVHKDAQRLLKNINTLSAAIDIQYNKLAHKLQGSSHPELAAIRDDYKVVQDELNRQVSLLNALLDDTLKPSSRSIDDLAKDMSSFKGLLAKVKRGDQGEGSKALGEKIAYVMAGMNSTAAAARVVDKALQKVGLSYAQYASLKNYTDLRDTLESGTQKILNKDKNALVEYERAKKVLYSQQYHHDDIVKELKSKKGAAEEVTGGLKVDKAVRETRELKKELLKSFVRSLGIHFNNVLNAAERIASGIATGKIKHGEKLEKFARALEMLQPLDKSYVFYALSGYEHSARATESRETFLSSLRYVIAVCGDLSKEREEGFSDIKANLEEIVKLIIDYSERFAKGFGSTYTGSGEDELPASIIKVGFDLEKVKTLILYYSRVAKIKDGLKRSHMEVAEVAKGYPRILGDAIGEKINATLKAFDEKEKRFKEDPTMKYIFNSPKFELMRDELLGTHKKFYDTKIKMYKIAEAIDLYLMSFTDSITAHPDEVKNIMEMLNNIEIISKWFNNHSGDMLCHVFDSFPGAYTDADAKSSKLNESYADEKDMHYYERVMLNCRLGKGDFPFDKSKPSEAFKEYQKSIQGHDWAAVVVSPAYDKDKRGDVIDGAAAAMSLPGNPFLGLQIFGDVKEKRINFKKLEDMLDKSLSVNILKNIISIFVNVADKFGETRIQDKSSMSPVQIFKGLCDYIKYSSLSCGIDRFNLTKDITLKGLKHVKKAINTPPNAKMIDEQNTTYGRGPADDTVRIGVHGSNVFSGQNRQFLNSLNQKIEDASSCIKIAERDFKDSLRTLENIKTGAAAVAFGKTDFNRLGGHGNSILKSNAALTPPESKGLVETMKLATSSLIHLAKWYHIFNEIIINLNSLKNTNNKQIGDLVSNLLKSSNLKEQAKIAHDLLTKDDAGFIGAAVQPLDNLSLPRFFIGLVQPSSTPPGQRWTNGNTTTDVYGNLVKEHLIPAFTDSILGLFYPCVGCKYANFKMDDRSCNGNALVVVQRSIPSYIFVSTWQDTKIDELANLFASMKESETSDRDDLLWREVGYVGMRGVGDFRSKARWLMDLNSNDPAAVANRNYSPFEDIFEDTDNLFKMCIKSIVAKILTAIGTFNMFNRQFNPDGAGYHSGLRMILGGSEGGYTPELGNVQILDEALELYMRMPLLVEFYKKVMNINTGAAFAFVPEIDNVYGGIIRIIFNKNVEQGMYSDTDIREIIIEVNKIYIAKKDKSITEIVNEFVSEINARYGLTTTKDIEAYAEDRRKFDEVDYDPDVLPLSFGLNGINEDDDMRREAPSDKYTDFIKNKGFNKHKYTINFEQQKKLYTLRKNIADMFKKAEGKRDMASLEQLVTMDVTLRSSKEELRVAVTPEDKYKVIRGAISGFSQVSMPVLDKAYIMLHELVVAPLNVLNGIYVLMDNFNNNIKQMAVACSAAKAWALGACKDANSGVFVGDNSLLEKLKVEHNKEFGTVSLNEADYAKLLYGVGASSLTAANVGARVIITQGTNRFGYLGATDLTYAQLNALTIAPLADEELKWGQNLARRFAFDLNKMLVALYENIFTFSSGLEKLVEVNIDASYNVAENSTNMTIYVNISALKEYVTKTLDSVKKVTSKLKGILPRAAIEKVESRSNIGSIYYIEDNLVNKLINDEYNVDINRSNLDKLSAHIRTIVEALTEKYVGDARNISNAGTCIGDEPTAFIANGAKIEGASASHEYNREMYKLILWDPTDVDVNTADFAQDNVHTYDAAGAVGAAAAGSSYSNLTITGKIANSYQTEQTIFKYAYDSSKVAAGRPELLNEFQIEGTNSTGYAQAIWDKENGLRSDQWRSVVVTFNRLVALYLNVLFDPSTTRVYKTTIDHFANEVFSHAIRGNNYIDDLAKVEGGIDSKPDLFQSLKQEGVLTKSLALIIKTIYTLSPKNNKPELRVYLENDLNELPSFLKEKYRGGFPVMIRLFNTLIKRCELLKPFVQNLNVGMWVAGKTPNVIPIAPLSNPKDSNIHGKDVLTHYLDEVIIGSRGLIKCMETTLAELGYSPKYLEIYRGFLSEYKALNGKDAYTLLSHSARLLKNEVFDVNKDKIDSASYDLVQVKSVTNKFKYLYGLGVLIKGQKLKFEDMPSLKVIFDQYNHAVDAKHKLSDDELLSNVNLTYSGLLYISDILKIKSLMKSFDTTKPNDNAQNAIAFDFKQGVDLTPPKGDKSISLWQSDNADQDVVISALQSTNVRDLMHKIVQHMGGAFGISGDRENMIVKNIVDLNVVPINVHSLMREVPIVNLYNYSYTYDKMIGDLLGCGEEFDVKHNLTANDFGLDEPSGRKLLYNMMLEPHIGMDFDVYDACFSKIMRGDIGIEGLERPRYIADEIYNKALFGEVIGNDEYKEEGGTGASDAYERGTSNANTQSRVEKLNKKIFKGLARILLQNGGYGAYFAGRVAGYGKGLLPSHTNGAKVAASILEGERRIAVGLLAANTDEAVKLLLSAIYDKLSISGYDDFDAAFLNEVLKNIPVANREIFTRSYISVGGKATSNIFDATDSNKPNQIKSQLIQYLRHIYKYIHSSECAQFYKEYPDILVGDDADESKMHATLIGRILDDYVPKLEKEVRNNGELTKIWTDHFIALGAAYTAGATKNDVAFEILKVVNKLPSNLANSVKSRLGNIDIINGLAEASTKLTVQEAYDALGNAIKSKCSAAVAAISTHALATVAAGAGLPAAAAGNEYDDVLVAAAAESTRAAGGGAATAKSVVELSLAALDAGSGFISAASGDELIELHQTTLYDNWYNNHLFPMMNGAAANVLNASAIDGNGKYAEPLIAGANNKLGARALDRINDLHTATRKLNVKGMNWGDKANYLQTSLIPKLVTPYLHWLENKEVKKINVGNHKYMLKFLGKMRFDTVLVRNLVWLANIQRLLRLKLRRDLTWYDSKVVSKHAVTATSITELVGNDTSRDSVYEYDY